MKRQIRRGTFETNSSSVHSLTICMKSEFDRWVRGELAWSQWNDQLVEVTPEVKASIENDERDYLTYEQFNDWRYNAYETFEKKYTTPKNEELVAFGYYGDD